MFVLYRWMKFKGIFNIVEVICIIYSYISISIEINELIIKNFNCMVYKIKIFNF